MSSETIEQRVRKIIVTQLQVEEDAVKGNAHFIKDLGADSLDIVELVMKIEEEFGVDISDDEAESIQSVEDAIEFVKKREEI